VNIRWHQPPIFLVEDHENDQFFVRHALEGAKIENPLVVCASADEAREALRRHQRSAAPVLFILDVNLVGGETGVDFLEWLRRQPEPLGSTPAMMLSGSERPDDRAMAQRLGATRFLQKPVMAEKLAEAVQALGFVVVTSALSGRLGFRLIERG
jgi:CheY-like chemotaxis protein